MKKINAIFGKYGEPKGGVICALQIPTDKDGKLMKYALEKNINWLKTVNIGGLLVLGSSGEFLKLSLNEEMEVLDFVAEVNNGDFPLIANCTANTVRDVSALAKVAEKNKYNSISLMPQFFYPQTQDDMLEFFLRCSDNYSLPTLLYNFPERTGTRIGIDVVRSFAQNANMTGIKQSGAEFEYNKELVESGKELGFSVFSGADCKIPELLSLGCVGCIGGFVNIFPEYMAQQYAICAQNQDGDLDTISERVRLAGSIVDRLTFPVNLVYGMRGRWLEAGESKMPESAQTKTIGSEVVSTLQKLFSEWGLNKPY